MQLVMHRRRFQQPHSCFHVLFKATQGHAHFMSASMQTNYLRFHSLKASSLQHRRRQVFEVIF